MGVKGLWRLLLPIGRRISIETLHGKVLAVDASIWLTQFLKAMRDPETGRVTAAAHLIGFFRRLCRLRFHGIRPVFVFDGATPEIKRREVNERRRRREQFAVLTDGSVQRLARKILQETLQRKQKEAVAMLQAPGAFVAGFDPGDQVAASARVVATNVDDVITTDEKGSSSALDDEVEVFDMLSLEIPHPVATVSDDVNDWDLPLAVAAAEEAKEREAGGNDDESSVEYEDFNDFTARPKKVKDGAFSVEYVASLPAVQRKDAIETAKREQRLQSRSDFMPVAASPANFSSVQIRNFLKSCQLNRDIHAMAKSAALKDNHGLPGELAASDRTTRVELIREVEADHEEVSVKEPRSSGKFRHQSKRGAKLLEASAKRSSADDSSEDEDWGEALPGMIVGKKTRRVVDDDASNDENSVEELRVRSANGHVYVRDTVDLVDGDSDEGSGYEAPLQESKPKARVAAINADGTDDASDGEGGGFSMASSDVKPSSAARASAVVDVPTSSDDDSMHGVGDGFFKNEIRLESTMTRGDAAYAQELDDQTLAQALQRDEDHLVIRSEADDMVNDMVKHVQLGEDGDRQGIGDQVLALVMQQFEHDTGDVEIRQAAVGPAVDAPALPSRSPLDGALNYGGGESSADEDDVDWEEGDAASSGEIAAAIRPTEGKPTDSHHDSNHSDDLKFAGEAHDWEVDGPFFEDGDVKNTLGGNSFESSGFASDEKQSSVAINSRAGGTSVQDVHRARGPLTPETSAALMQAQATAANLTNWAGRAFRRAIQEAGGGQDASLDAAAPAHPGESGAPKRAGRSPDGPNAESEDESEETEPAVSHATGQKSTTDAERDRTQGLAAPRFDASFLAENDALWTAERNRRERDMDTISDEMLLEVKQLLQLFGVPYIEAPTEAEAQCAALEELGLVNGIVTEDSDVFVFGGKTVYKNIFDEQKYAEVYAAEDAEREMNLGRNAMVALAMLLGGDYTEGVKGVGIVNAMEILDTFDVSSELKVGLENFRKWLDGFDPADALGVKSSELGKTKKEIVFHSQHKTARTRWIAPANFPAEGVMKAYLDPVVDKSKERFSWGGVYFK